MANCGWLIEKKHSKKYGSEQFLRVKPDCKLRVRLIDNPVKVVKIFSNHRKCAVLNNEDVGRRLKEKYTNKLSSVNIRYACWCIDRDSKLMKILDMPQSVARAFGNRTQVVGKKISGIEEGCDWIISTNGKKGKNVRYEVVYIEETPLTYEEIKMVEYKKEETDGHFDLTKIFNSCSFYAAEEKLFG